MMSGRTGASTAVRASGAVACGLALLLFGAPAVAKTVKVTQSAPACINWAGWHEWSLASLTPRGARYSKYCPTSIDKGQVVEMIDDDAGEGAVTVRWRGKVWFVDADRLSE